jgi:REP element-mobilizing transposase RayT
LNRCNALQRFKRVETLQGAVFPIPFDFVSSFEPPTGQEEWSGIDMKRMHAGVNDWHLFNRGSRRMALFHDDQDARVFLARLRKAAELAGCIVWAYTLMTNHFHLVVRASSEQLSRFTHHLQRLYSLYHNHRWNLSGCAFAGPYGLVRQASPGMLLRTLAYVFLNPVTARLVDRPEDWTWTSFRAFMGIGPSWLWLNPLPLLGEID